MSGINDRRQKMANQALHYAVYYGRNPTFSLKMPTVGGSTPMGQIKSQATNSSRRKKITLPKLKCLEQPE